MAERNIARDSKTCAAVRDAVAAFSFGGAAPGHRFNLYFEGFRSDWAPGDGDKAAGLRKVLALGDTKAVLESLVGRQLALGASIPEDRFLGIEARVTAPFATGLGIEHPVENGFAFLSPYGLPYLAASGVKGVLRRAAEELVKEDAREFSTDRVAALFGSTDDKHPHRGSLAFWDVFPLPANDKLVVEIMTPHYSHYYQPVDPEAAPHDAGKPTPIPFLAVPEGSRFSFFVTFESVLWPAVVPMPQDWKALVRRMFEYAFDWLGFGAKTALGYGAMTIAQSEPAQAARASQATVRRATTGSPAREEEWTSARLTWAPGTKEINATFGGKTTAGLRGSRAEELLSALGERAKRLQKDKEIRNVSVRVRIEGNLITLIGLVDKPSR